MLAWIHLPLLSNWLTSSSSTREIRTIIRGLEGINLVSADIVEVSAYSSPLEVLTKPADDTKVAPAYDTNAELTTMAAADVLYEVMTLFTKAGALSEMVKGVGSKSDL